MQDAGVPTPLTMCSAPLSTYRALDAWTPIRFLFLFFIKHVIRAIVTLIHVPDNMKQVLRPIFQLAKSRSGPISLGGEGRRRHESEEEKQGEATACRPHHRWSKCRPGSRWTDRGGGTLLAATPPEIYHQPPLMPSIIHTLSVSLKHQGSSTHQGLWQDVEENEAKHLGSANLQRMKREREPVCN